MFSTKKIRRALITLVAVTSFAATLVAPAVSQAQWHTIVVNGHVFTHGNFTEGGVSPCTRIEGQLGSWEQAVGDYSEWVGRHNAGEATAKEELENAEGEVNRAQGEAFEYGCDGVAAAKAPKGGTAAKGGGNISLTVGTQRVRGSA
jgi:hypothetical protein